MHKLILAAAAAAIAMLATGANAQAVRIATEGAYAPWNFLDEAGKPAGLDVDGFAGCQHLFKDIAVPFEVGRYHSWVVDPASLPESLTVTSVDTDGQIMSLRHKELDICGVQFHPESVLTPQGKQMMKNWLEGSEK